MQFPEFKNGKETLTRSVANLWFEIEVEIVSSSQIKTSSMQTNLFPRKFHSKPEFFWQIKDSFVIIVIALWRMASQKELSALSVVT